MEPKCDCKSRGTAYPGSTPGAPTEDTMTKLKPMCDKNDSEGGVV